MQVETCAGSGEQDEYSADKSAYCLGKRAYGSIDRCPYPDNTRMRDMWNMGYNYMHSLSNV